MKGVSKKQRVHLIKYDKFSLIGKCIYKQFIVESFGRFLKFYFTTGSAWSALPSILLLAFCCFCYGNLGHESNSFQNPSVRLSYIRFWRYLS